MSINRMLAIILMLVLGSCDMEEASTFEKKSLSQEELDSLARHYQNLSYGFVQPTQAHRIYKDSAIMYRPDNVENVQVGSYSYKKRGEHIRAMEMLNTAVELDVAEYSVDALQYRAWSFLYFYRDYEKTLLDIKKINTMSKSDYSICWGEPCGFIEGQANYKLGNYVEALANFKLVNTREIELGFDIEANFMNFFYQARCYHKLGENEGALKMYNYVLEIHNTYPQAYFWKGMLLNEIGDYNQAISTLEKSLSLLNSGYKTEESYFERFDEVFPYMIEEALREINLLKNS